MEPFGLFQFLQTLLQNPPSDTQNEVDSPKGKTEEKQVVSAPPPTNDTYLQFIANHEKRTQGIRKK